MGGRIRSSVLFAVMIALGAACIASARAAAVEEAPPTLAPPGCLEAKTLPKHDRWHGFAEITVRTATRDTPEIVEFETDGIADVALDRAMRQFVGRVRLDVEEVSTAPGLATGRCSTGWFELNHIVQVRVPARTEGRHFWRVSLFEDTAARPSDDDPYLITLHVMSTNTLDQRSGFHKDSEFSGIPTEPQTVCTRMTRALPPDTELEPAIATAQDEVPGRSSWLLYANAGRRAYLKISAPYPIPVRVKIYAKEAGGRAFTGICHAEGVTVGPEPTDYVVGSLPWERHEVAFWRIEIVPEQGSVNTQLTATVFRAHNPLQQISTSAEERTKMAIGVLTESYQCRTSKPPAVRGARCAESGVAVPVYKTVTGGTASYHGRGVQRR
jgi:hypothetical protein